MQGQERIEREREIKNERENERGRKRRDREGERETAGTNKTKINDLWLLSQNDTIQKARELPSSY